MYFDGFNGCTINEAQEKIIKRIESIDAKTKLDVFKEGKKPKPKKQKRKMKIKKEPGTGPPRKKRKRKPKTPINPMSFLPPMIPMTGMHFPIQVPPPLTGLELPPLEPDTPSGGAKKRKRHTTEKPTKKKQKRTENPKPKKKSKRKLIKTSSVLPTEAELFEEWSKQQEVNITPKPKPKPTKKIHPFFKKT